MQLRFRTSLADDPCVVGALVIVRETRQHVACAMDAIRLLFDELIRDREQERDERTLVLRLDAQDIEANTLRRRRIIEQPIALGLLQCRGDSLSRDGLEFHPSPPKPWRPSAAAT